MGASYGARVPIRRNTALLGAALASSSAMLQLQAAVGSITLVLVLGTSGLLGLGPAIVLTAGALAALPGYALVDAAEMAALLRGSLRYRTFVV